MKETRSFLVISVSLIFGMASSAFAQGFRIGAEAYKKGDFATALREFRLLAEKQSWRGMKAKTFLGFMSLHGHGVSQDHKEAVEWFRLAAKTGHIGAQYQLGKMYRLGLGVAQNDKTAIKWWKLSAEEGNADAQFSLGATYQLGQRAPRDYEEALKWHRLAAEQGNEDAQNSLGTMYGLGHGVIQDNIYAHMWFSLAALSGHKIAIKNQGLSANQMTTADISQAENLVRECIRKNYKVC